MRMKDGKEREGTEKTKEKEAPHEKSSKAKHPPSMYLFILMWHPGIPPVSPGYSLRTHSVSPRYPRSGSPMGGFWLGSRSKMHGLA